MKRFKDINTHDSGYQIKQLRWNLNNKISFEVKLNYFIIVVLLVVHFLSILVHIRILENGIDFTAFSVRNFH